MDFFDQFMNFFEDENLREQLLGMIMSEDNLQGEKMITGHFSDQGDIVFSVFDFEEWKMIQEMSLILDKDIEDIIKDLSPDEVQQLYIRPD